MGVQLFVGLFVMPGNMTEEVSVKSNKPTENPKEIAAMSATARANEMLREVCGPRGWNDTRESWLARGARAIGMSPRRARALFYQEPIRLSADEYLQIERAYTAAHAAVARVSHLASRADVPGGESPGATGRGSNGTS